MTTQLEQIKTLQHQAQKLEFDQTLRTQQFKAVHKYAESFLEKLPTLPVYTPPGDRSETIKALSVSTSPTPLTEVLTILEEHVDGVGQNLGSSGFMGYIPSGGIFPAALGDYLSAITNRYAGVAYASPGSARMEDTLLSWLAQMVGYPSTADGDFTSGGSMATLSALVAAREAHTIVSQNVATTVVYLTTQTHHSFRKALHITGLSDCVVREVPCDDRNRMAAQPLQQLISSDRKNGLQPWLVAATAGTTNMGAVDPLNEIADITEREKLWFHVDAAYGGTFMLCTEGKRRLRGIERSDSMVLDPHKGFFLPGGLGVVLVRDGTKLYDAYHARGAYMQDITDETERSPCDYSPELTRPFRSLRFWLPLKLLGSDPFKAALEEKLLLASYFYEQLEQMDGIERGPHPDLSIVTFRYLPSGGNPNEYNEKLVAAIRQDGRILLTSTTINEHYIIRLAVLGYNTHLETIDTALSVIQGSIAHLNKSWGKIV